MVNRVRSYLSDKGVRLKKGTRLTQTGMVEEQIRPKRQWPTREWQVMEGMLLELRHAEQQRRHWRGLIAQEVLSDPLLASLLRLCGVREMIAFALGAFIGDIKRFASPKSLVKYVGLDPAFDDSGESEWHGGLSGHGNKYVRSLLIEGAQALVRCSRTPLGQWGRKLSARKGKRNLAVAAVARKLTVAVWYLLTGRWTELEEIDRRLSIKLGKIIGQIGADRLKALGKTAKSLRQEVGQLLKTAREKTPPRPEKEPAQPQPDTAPKTKIYVLDPKKKFTPKAKANSLAAEHAMA
jgi:predicted DNA-binding ribbon-helix-helix protein